MMKRLLACFLALLPIAMALGGVFVAPALAADSAPTVAPPSSLSAESAILIEAEDKAVLYEKNAYAPMGMASTTKIMTALVAAELLEPDAMLTVPKEAVGIEGSSVYLTEGEKLTARELLCALMLASANDAAVALALAASGSVEAFCDQMNRKAQELGLENTHFVNPHGLADDNHYTTAYDLALIGAAALEHPLLREIAATKKTTIPFDGIPDRRYLINHNKMLSRYDGAIGLKTGFTKKTGRCLVSAAQRDGMTLIAVTLNAPDDWNDHEAMLDYGFSAYRRLTLFEAGGFCYSFPVVGGEASEVSLTNTLPVTLLLPADHPTPTLTVETVTRFEYAPVTKDQSLGCLRVSCGGKEITVPLVARDTVAARRKERDGFFSRAVQAIRSHLTRFLQIFQSKE